MGTRAAAPWAVPILSILAGACGGSNGGNHATTMDAGAPMLGQSPADGAGTTSPPDGSTGSATPPPAGTGGSGPSVPPDAGAVAANDGAGPPAMIPGVSEGGSVPADGGASSLPQTGIFPPITDPGVAGPFTPTSASNTGPNSNYMAFYPQEISQNGFVSPIVIWGNGATVTSPTVYGTLLNHIASHGFSVLAYNTTPQGSDMSAAIDWMIAEDMRQGSMFYGKLDTSKIAAMGHSAGSLAAFAIANDPRLTTTMHLNGGTMSPHTDLMNLRQPAAFVCGDSGGDGLITGDVARPNCDSDFMMATTPVFYGDVIGASHLTVATAAATDPLMKAFLGATAGWLRWQLASDQTMKAYFVPASTCTFCTQTSVWTIQEKNL